MNKKFFYLFFFIFNLIIFNKNFNNSVEINFDFIFKENNLKIKKEEFFNLLENSENTKKINSSNNSLIKVFEEGSFEKISNFSESKKKWTILIYIAGDNNLYKFALRNIAQLKEIGSNELLNIVIHFDHVAGNKQKMTKRYFVKRNKLLQIGDYSAMDSGSENTLIDACSWAIKNFPSDNFGLVLWNHGSGDLNPGLWGNEYRESINSSEMFYFDPLTKKIELNKNFTYSEFIENKIKERGICFDDTTRNYLDDIKLTKALSEVNKILGKKIDVIIMDACLMAGIGTAHLCEPYASYLVASQEVVLALGHNYATMLKPLSRRIYNAEEFSKHVVKAYQKTYAGILNDYTQSCINLSLHNEIIAAINNFCEIVLDGIKNDKSNLIKKFLISLSNKSNLKNFREPSYVDMKDFFLKVKSYFNKIDIYLSNGEIFKEKISECIDLIIFLHNKYVFENATGNNLNPANGISIYFPSEKIHDSFPETFYGKDTKWINLLNQLFYSNKKNSKTASLLRHVKYYKF